MGFGLVNPFIGCSQIETTVSSYTLKIAVNIAHKVFNTSQLTATSLTASQLPLTSPGPNAQLSNFVSGVESSLMLRPTVSRPVFLGMEHLAGAYDQNNITVRQLRVC
jgi:hypothetical protein